MSVTATDLINIPISTSAIRWATYTSVKKFPHTSQGTRNRSALEKLDNLFRGDLAKNALIEYLQSRGVTISQEYDRVRTDNFTSYNPVGFHFIANDTKIESNSSLFPYGKNKHTALDCDIKVTAGDGSKIWTLPLHHKFDTTVQMYFDTPKEELSGFFNDQKIKEISLEVESMENPILDEVISSLNAENRYSNTLIGYGWASKQDINQIKLNNTLAGQPTTWSYSGNTRTYWNCKIRDTNPFITLHTNL
jgi:hypothetical protein